MVNILITGANRGIGLGLVKEFLKDKRVKHIFATHRDNGDSKALRSIKDDRLHVYEMDVLYDDEMWKAVKKVDELVGAEGLNLIVNNAGVFYEYDTSGNVLRKLMCQQMEVNAASPLIVVQNFLPFLRRAAKTGNLAAIVNITGKMASIERCTGATARHATIYRMSKAALNMLTRVLSADLKGEQITVVSLCPGHVKTEIGGSGAEISVDQCVKTLADVMLNKMDMSRTGQFLDRMLQPIPY